MKMKNYENRCVFFCPNFNVGIDRFYDCEEMMIKEINKELKRIIISKDWMKRDGFFGYVNNELINKIISLTYVSGYKNINKGYLSGNITVRLECVLKSEA